MAGFQGVELFAPTLADTLTGLLVSLALSTVIALVYHITYHGPGYARSYVTSLVILSLITTLVIMVIGNNLARAFGLVGALSIIRFRTAVKDTIDIVYIFFALAVGMASGVGYFRLAVAGTIVIALVLLVASRSPFQMFQRPRFLLQLSGQRVTLEAVAKVLQTHCVSFEMVNVRRPSGTDMLECSYMVGIRNNDGHLPLLDALTGLEGMQAVQLYHDEDPT
jgi:hypothetical protein